MAERTDLERPYRHPYRTYVPGAVRAAGAPLWAGGGLLVALVCCIGAIATGDDAWLAYAAASATGAAAFAGYWTAMSANEVRKLAREWDQASELARVRSARPHRAERHPLLAHDEFAVTVEDDALWIWAFQPLAVDEDEPPGTVYVPGRPRYAGRVVDEIALDPDAATAAEQLSAAQQTAATLEQQAIVVAERDTARAIDAAERRRELASTADALRHLTGQKKR